MAKKVARSITLSQDVIDEINALCEHKKAFSSKAEEIIKIGLTVYKQGARIETKEVVSLTNIDNSTKKVDEQTPKFNSKFLKG